MSKHFVTRSRALTAAAASLAVAALLAVSGCATTDRTYVPDSPSIPRTSRAFAAAPGDFHFMVLGNRTGGLRPGVFERALKIGEQLRPDFIINIGDLIEGNTEDPAKLEAEWSDVNGSIAAIDVPFFYVPGNHDLTNETMRTDWRKRLGADYYSFVYRGVLFLALNTEDPPQPEIARMQLVRQYGFESVARVMRALIEDPAGAEARLGGDPKLLELLGRMKSAEAVKFSAAQVEMVRRALERHRDVRWTFVLMHRPAWKYDSPEFAEIRRLLADRPYTMLAGHYHRYVHESRDGHDLIQLGTTGGIYGGASGDPAAVDHLMWVSVTNGAPRISNIRLDGYFDAKGPRPAPDAAPRAGSGGVPSR